MCNLLDSWMEILLLLFSMVVLTKLVTGLGPNVVRLLVMMNGLRGAWLVVRSGTLVRLSVLSRPAQFSLAEKSMFRMLNVWIGWRELSANRGMLRACTSVVRLRYIEQECLVST